MNADRKPTAAQGHEAGEGCLDCPHPDYCAGMGKCEIGAAKRLNAYNKHRDDAALGYCPHGVNLDRDFCPEGCRV